MVYCAKCGTKNPDDAKVCSQCGASLYPVREERQHYYRRYERECFGIPGGGAIVGLAIGVVIVLAGLLWFMQQTGLVGSEVSIWPFAAIIFGVLIIMGAIFGMRRRH